MQRPLGINASQINKYLECPAALGFAFIDGIEHPVPAHTQFGLDVHEHHKRYLMEGAIPNASFEGLTARAQIPFLPAPRGLVPGVTVEQILYLQYEGILFQGTPDFVSFDRLDKRLGSEKSYEVDGFPTHDEDGNPIPLIVDHKTRSSLPVLSQERANLENDIQLNLYCMLVANKYNQIYGFYPKRIQCSWQFNKRIRKDTDKPAVRPCVLEKDMQDVMVFFHEKIVPLARTIVAIYAQADKLRSQGIYAGGHTLPKNLSSCTKRDGCRFGTPLYNAADTTFVNVCRKTDNEQWRSVVMHQNQNDPNAAIMALGADFAAQFAQMQAQTGAMQMGQQPAQSMQPMNNPQSMQQPVQNQGQPMQGNAFMQGQPMQGNAFMQGQPMQQQAQPVQQAAQAQQTMQPQNTQAQFPNNQQMQGMQQNFTQPMQAQPMQAQPMQAQPMQAQPMQAQPMQAQPMQNPNQIQGGFAQPMQGTQMQGSFGSPMQAQPLQDIPAWQPPAGCTFVAQNPNGSVQLKVQNGTIQHFGIDSVGQPTFAWNASDLVGPPPGYTPSKGGKGGGRKSKEEISEEDKKLVQITRGDIRVIYKLLGDLLKD